jgi:hypothetical protein
MIGDPKTSMLRSTPDEMNVIDMRMTDSGVTESGKINYNHIKESLKEPRYYCYIISIILIFTKWSSESIRSDFGV